ncbi:hypothetical protein VKT23_011399 [Stygiomarasmius scandens]|uniref:Uncharacterized protein n=1 Tax=Marasmiellus scandens TaxID=2682957 RepID=A0ABR1JE11_9AGAR
MAPSSPVSFFDSIQNQPNAMDDLESSEEDSDEDDMSSMTSDSSLSGRRHLEDAHSFSQFSSTPLSPVHPHYALSSQATQRGSTHSQIPMYGAGRSVRPEGSEGVSGSGFGISTGASMLMRLGNHSTPYFSPSSSIKSNTASPSQSRSPLYSSSNSPLSTHPYANSSLSLNHKSSSRSNLNLTSHSMMPPPSPTPSQFSLKDRSLDNPDFRPKEHIAKPKTQPEFLKDVAKGKSKGVGLKSVGIGLGITGKGRDRSKSIGEQGSRVEGGKKDKGKGKEPSLPPPASFNFYQRPQNRGLHGSASFEYPRSQSSLAGGYGSLGVSGGGKRRPATTETSSPSTSASPSAAASAMASPLVSPTWAPSYGQPGQTQSFSGLGPATSGIGGQQAVALAKAKAEARERDQESMRKLDGLLIQHMEAEKNRMRKIAKSASSGSGKT